MRNGLAIFSRDSAFLAGEGTKLCVDYFCHWWLSLNIRNRMAVSRRDRSKALPVWLTRVIACGLFFIFSAGFISLAHDLSEDYRLYRHGIFTQGMALRTEHHGKSGELAVYNFKYNQATYEGMSDMKSSWEGSQVLPAPVRVQFLASDPMVSRLPDVRDPILIWWEISFCGFYCVAMLFLGLVIILECRDYLEGRRARQAMKQPWQLPSFPKAWH
jgi:hypothetical protein